MAPKMDRKTHMRAIFWVLFSRPVPKADFWIHIGRLLVRFGSFLAPFGRHFGSKCILLEPFRLSFATLADHALTFDASWFQFCPLCQFGPAGSLLQHTKLQTNLIHLAWPSTILAHLGTLRVSCCFCCLKFL